MQKSTIRIIIILSAISLLGLVVTQTFWVMKAVNIAERQHDHRVNIALDEVINEMVTYQDTSISFSAAQAKLKVPPCKKTFFEVIDTVLLDRLMRKYIDYHRLNENYYYAIVQTRTDSIIYGSAPDMEKYRTREPHKACLSCLWNEEYFHLEVYFPSQRRQIILEMSMWLGASGLFILVVILSFTFIITTIIRQKKLSEIKNDFINNMTHEFKTPISTISLAAEVLIKADPSVSMDRIQKYSRIIYDENQRMRNQVERVLQVALLDRGEFRLNKTEFDLHQLIRETIQNQCIEKCEEQTTFTWSLLAEQNLIVADKMHITNVIVNLVDNAIKYSRGETTIRIESKNTEGGISFSLEDNGIGMTHETIKHIFDKFYRVPTGNIHNTKGFGLGLYYVRNIIEMHGGHIDVTSEPNKGSRFEVFLPLVTA
jgi:two-component system phosphate regulon sensor histidine kinase PhoR